MTHHDRDLIERPAPWLIGCAAALDPQSEFNADVPLKLAMLTVLRLVEWEHLPLPTTGHP